jgi:probable HAF family extracellular repeat protein
MHDLGTLGGALSYSQGINDSGQVVGFSQISAGNYHAFLYDGTTMHDLGTLGGPYSYANGINSSGQVVGESYTSDFSSHAFLYDGTTMHDLGTLGGLSSTAFGINDLGQVVGADYFVEYSGTHAFLYDGTTTYDLNDLLAADSLGWTIFEARAINNSGQIAATGRDSSGHTHALLLNPVSSVPEPSSFIMLGLGSLALIGLRKSRQARG